MHLYGIYNIHDVSMLRLRFVNAVFTMRKCRVYDA